MNLEISVLYLVLELYLELAMQKLSPLFKTADSVRVSILFLERFMIILLFLTILIWLR